MSSGHRQEASRQAPPDLPPWWRPPLDWLHATLLVAAALVPFGPHLWLAELVLPYSPLLILLLGLAWATLYRRRRGRATLSLLALMVVAWPWAQAAWQARAPLPIGAVEDILVLDASAWQPTNKALPAALAQETAALAVILHQHPAQGDRLQAALAAYADRPVVLVHDLEHPVRVLLATRASVIEPPRRHVVPASPALVLEVRLRRPECLVLLLVTPADTSPGGFQGARRGEQLVQELLAASDPDLPVLLVLPQGLSPASQRWQALQALGLRQAGGSLISLGLPPAGRRVYLAARGMALAPAEPVSLAGQVWPGSRSSVGPAAPE